MLLDDRIQFGMGQDVESFIANGGASIGLRDFFYLNCAVDRWLSGNPLSGGGRAATAVAQRRGGFFVINTHPEAFGFCPSYVGI